MPTIQFKGKSFVQNHHLAVPYHQLIPKRDKSVTGSVSLHDNLIVQGDNLIALKALLPTYASKIGCIYIDPPYNTGNEGWTYNDNVNSPYIKEWLKDKHPIDKEDLTRHDKWLCMMMPRIRILHELLSEDGVIAISNDDNENGHLRLLLNEIFGEENFIANVIWQKNYSPKSSAKFLSVEHEYITFYAKDINKATLNLFPRTDDQDSLYKNPDNDPRGLWRPNNFAARNFYSKGTYPITTPSGRVIPGPPKGLYWRSSEEKFKELDADGRIYWGKDGNNIPAPKIYLSEVMQGRIPRSIWSYEEAGHTQDAKREMLSLLDFETSDDVFVTPKPTKLVKRILTMLTRKDSIVLDSFAGTGTTAQAVLELNKEDGGNRQFILVEMEDYADKITAERVRRVIKGVPAVKNELVKKGLGGTFSYFELGDPIETEGILDGTKLPSYLELARYVYYTATGEEFDESKLDEKTGFIGASSHYDVYMIYKPDLEYLKQTALTLNKARELRSHAGTRPLLVFAPTKYVETGELDELNIDFCQLPFEIYKVGK